MSRRRDIRLRLKSLGEIQDIMGAMKNLAFMETRKLAAFLSAQQRAVQAIMEVASDFSAFHDVEVARNAREIQLLIGSERGLCGNFNESLIGEVDSGRPVISIGSRLEGAIQERLAIFPGASVAEEIGGVLIRVVDFLAAMQSALPEKEVIGITAIYHTEERIRTRRLLPLPKAAVSRHAYPPILNLDPSDFLEKLSGHYLYAALQEALSASLMAENRYRLDHMENAMRQMERRIGSLGQRYNQLRQEEITEEIEVIMLSAEALSPLQSQQRPNLISNSSGERGFE